MSTIVAQKYQGLFRAYDFDGNGYIDKADIEALAARVGEHQHRSGSSAAQADLSTKAQAFWNALYTHFDKDKDGRVTYEEFQQFFEDVKADPEGKKARSIAELGDGLFYIADHDGNNTLSEDEFRGLCLAYKIDATKAAKAFRLLDKDHNGRITLEEWRALVVDILASNQSDDAASTMFGGAH